MHVVVRVAILFFDFQEACVLELFYVLGNGGLRIVEIGYQVFVSYFAEILVLLHDLA